METFKVGKSVTIGDGRLAVLAGPCMAESLDICLEVAEKMKATCEKLGLEMKICDWADEAKAGADTGITTKEGKFNWCFCDEEIAKKFNEDSVRALDMEWYKHEYFKDYPFEKGMQRIYAAVDEFLLSLGYQHDRENRCYKKVGKSPERVALFAHGGIQINRKRIRAQSLR
jgi:hypothetical protein